MAKLHDLIRWCDQTLKSAEFKDYAPNGLQIEGKPEVKKILCAVTASQDAIEAAIAEQADVLLVHHGYFWKGEPYPITGMRGKRIKSLIQHIGPDFARIRIGSGTKPAENGNTMPNESICSITIRQTS